MRILLLGSSGMLGKSIYKFLKNDFEVYTNGLKKRRYDLCKKKNLSILLNKTKPDVIINSLGITNIEICNKNKKLAKKVNFEILKNLFNIKKRYNYKFWLIQISTDQLYDAISFKTKSREESKIKINNYYTKTKVQAERICELNKSLILRTNFFGKSIVKKKSFSDWVLKSSERKKTFYLFKDIYFSPLRFITICRILKKIVQNNFDTNGIYNLGSKNGLSKLNFSLFFLKYLKIKNKNFRIASVNKILKTKRSKNMLMNVEKFENTFKIKLPNLINEITNEAKENYVS